MVLTINFHENLVLLINEISYNDNELNVFKYVANIRNIYRSIIFSGRCGGGRGYGGIT